MSEANPTPTPTPTPAPAPPALAPALAAAAAAPPGPPGGEPLLAGASVRLFGSLFAGLTLGTLGPRPPFPGGFPAANQNLQLARIYGFSWQGNYFKMATPAVFVVDGPGVPVIDGLPLAAIGQVGLELKDEFFSTNVLMWNAYDVDFSVRIDITSGWLSEILIAAEASDATNVTGSGDGSDAGASISARQAMAARQAVVGRQAMVTRPRNS